MIPGSKISSPGLRGTPPAKPSSLTGLMIDARGMGSPCGPRARIVTQENEITADRVDKKFISGPSVAEPGRMPGISPTSKGSLHYKITANPLIIKASGTGKEQHRPSH